jgi:UDPglucose--hexose-1-phosphate uridylyltransferase
MVTDVLRTTLRHGDGRRLHVYGDHGPVRPLTAGEGAPTGLHLRHDALTDAWIGVSPARNTRPLTTAPSAGDRACPLCPGGPEVPFPYTAAVFENRFPSLVADPPPAPTAERATDVARGRCEVVLYTSDDEGSLARLDPAQLALVLAVWTDRSAALWAEPALRYVMIFENRGEEVGATISHPHGQIYAFDRLPPVMRDRVDPLARHRAATGSCLCCELVDADAAATDRHVVETDAFVVAVPFAARWPYEVHVRARRHGLRRLPDLTPSERADLGHALRTVVAAYDALYDRPLPYMMTIMEAPETDDGPASDWHLAVEFLPPNRAPDRLKVRASVETATGFFINDTVPERTAAELVTALREAGGGPTDAVPHVEVRRGEADHLEPSGALGGRPAEPA